MDEETNTEVPTDLRTYISNLALVKQNETPEIVTDYVVDYLNLFSQPLVSYEKDSFETKYVYGYGKISKTTKDLENEFTRLNLENILIVAPNIKIATEGLEKTYFHKNIIGTTTYVTDRDRKLITNQMYDSFGKNEIDPEDLINLSGLEERTNYTRHSYDEILESYFAQARIYEPDVKRFLAEDSIKDGLNWYGYANSNPIMYVDPSGLIPVIIRDFTTSNGGTVRWNEKTSTSTFTIRGKTLTTSSSGKNGHGLGIWNNSGRMIAQDVDLYKFFGISRPTNWGITEEVVNYVFNQNKTQGVWTSPIDAPQRYAGYNVVYDYAFGLVCDENLFISKFEYDRKDWMVEGWRGNYLNMGVGAEIGIYHLDEGLLGKIGSGQYWPVSGKDMLYMEYDLYNGSPDNLDLLYRISGTHWWLNGFRPGIGVIKAETLTLVGSITFQSKEMAEAFVAGLQPPTTAGTIKKDMVVNGSVVTFTWK